MKSDKALDYVTQDEIHALNVEKGFWKNQTPLDRVPACLMLIVTEVGEAMEHWRDMDLDNPNYSFVGKDGKPDGLAIELADAVIRIRDLSEALGFDLERQIAIKHNYNKKRPSLHGRNR